MKSALLRQKGIRKYFNEAIHLWTVHIKGKTLLLQQTQFTQEGLHPLEFLSNKEFNFTRKTKFRQPLVTSFTF